MKNFFLLSFLLTCAASLEAQDRFPTNQVSINGFRNPSIGLEYHRKQVSVHAGYYVTNFTSGITTEFVKAGVSYWFLPWGSKEIPSSLYVGSSYLYGTSLEYKDKSAVAFEAGARLMVWKGLNFRLGVIALAAEGQEPQINPTPSINYSIAF